MKYIYIDLYTHQSSIIDEEEMKECVQDLKRVEGDVTVWKGEECIVVEVKE